MTAPLVNTPPGAAPEAAWGCLGLLEAVPGAAPWAAPHPQGQSLAGLGDINTFGTTPLLMAQNFVE